MLIKRPVVKPNVPAKSATPVAPVKPGRKPATNNGEERATKSVTTRMPPGVLDMLDAAVASYESDRTEVIKRSIRLLNAALCGHNAVLIITDAAGKAKEINLVIDGVPT